MRPRTYDYLKSVGIEPWLMGFNPLGELIDIVTEALLGMNSRRTCTFITNNSGKNTRQIQKEWSGISGIASRLGGGQSNLAWKMSRKKHLFDRLHRDILSIGVRNI